jgi:CRP-like cAMP-binding protein
LYARLGFERAAMERLPVSNRLIEALPSEVYVRVCPALEYFAFERGDVVYDPGERMDYAYFPISVVVSVIHTMADGATAEIGLIGSEGVVGIALLLGGETTPDQAVAQVAGRAFRIKAQALLEEFRRGGPFQAALLSYTQALLTQVSQTAVCNRLHSIEQRLARWLLTIRDRLPSDEVHMTHESLAHVLGVRREGVTLTAHHLQEAGLIRYHHGHITIVDRRGLEAVTCECYRVVQDEFDRLLGSRTRLSRDETSLLSLRGFAVHAR